MLSQQSRFLSFVTLGLLAVPFVSAHGELRSVVIGGKSYDAPNIYYDGDAKNGNTPIRKGYRADGKAFLLPTDFNDDNKMACEEAGAAPGIAQAKPGDEVKWIWQGATPELSNAGYPEGTWVHAQGFRATYIASCNGDCKSANAADLGWQKIDFAGMRSGGISDMLRSAVAAKPEPYRGDGIWSLADLIENGSSYTSRIPDGLKNGQYMLRSELAALHNPWNANDPSSGPQNYAACAQIEITNGGDKELPYGTKAGSLYATDGYVAHYNVITDGRSFDDSQAGPAIWDGSSGSSGNSGSNNGGSQNNSGNTGGDQSNNGGNQSNNNGGQTNNGGDQSNNNGGQTNNGGDQTNNNGGQTNNGGDQTNNSGGQTNNGGDQTNNSGGQSNNGGDQSNGEQSNNNGGEQSNNSGDQTSNGGDQQQNNGGDQQQNNGGDQPGNNGASNSLVGDNNGGEGQDQSSDNQNQGSEQSQEQQTQQPPAGTTKTCRNRKRSVPRKPVSIKGRKVHAKRAHH